MAEPSSLTPSSPTASRSSVAQPPVPSELLQSPPTDAPSSAIAPSSPAPLCAICAAHAAKYTCPRCQTRTCSLPCSQTHKTLGTGCSGVRNKAAYVPMNQYGYMALMDDYVYLEEMGRKVAEWGREIVGGGYQAQSGDGNGRGRGRGRGRGQMQGRGRGHGRGGHAHGSGTRTKRDVLKMELDHMDIEMDLLPVGMERRILNQSTWDFNNKTALLTIEFVFNPPRFLAPSAHPPNPIRILTHRNRLSDSLLTNLRARLAERANSKREKDKHLPEWLNDMLIPNPDDLDAFLNPVCVMPTKLDPLASLASSHSNTYTGLRPGHITRNAFYKLAYDKPLEDVLKHKQFVEFPTIHVWEEGAFTGTIVDDRGSIIRKYDASDDEDERRPKRRKLGQREGKKALGGLLGGYGSASEDEENEKEEKNVLSLLSGYAGSDDEADAADGGEKSNRAAFESQFDYELGDEDAEGETDDGEGEFVDDEEGWAEEETASGGGSAQSPEAIAELLEQLRQAGALRDPTTGSRFGGLAVLDEDQVDWGDSADEGDG